MELENSFHYSVRDTSWIENEIILSQSKLKEMKRFELEPETMGALTFTIGSLLLILIFAWYVHEDVSEHTSYTRSVCFRGIWLEDTTELSINSNYKSAEYVKIVFGPTHKPFLEDAEILDYYPENKAKCESGLIEPILYTYDSVFYTKAWALPISNN